MQRISGVWLAALLALIVSVPTAHAQQARKEKTRRDKKASAAGKLDLTYVSGKALAALIVHPRKILSAPGVETLPIEVIQAQLVETTGIDPTQIDEAILLASFDPTRPQSAWGVILRSSQAFDQPAIVQRIAPNSEQAVMGLTRIHRAAEPDAPSVSFPDERTLLVAPEAQLREMLASRGAASPLIQRLRNLDPTTAVSGVFVVEPVRELLLGAVEQLPPLPPPVAELTTVPEHLAAVEMHLRLVPRMDLTLVLDGRDAAAAARLNQLLEESIDAANQLIDARIAELEASDAPAVEQATMRYARRMLALVVDSIDRQVEGTRLVLHTEGEAAAHAATVGTLTALLLPAVQAAREAARRAQASNNLRQIGIAFYNFHDVNNRFPGNRYDDDGQPLLSWRVHILPYLEQQPLYDQFHLDEPWDSEHNRALIAQMPGVYHSPSAGEALADAGKTVYLAPVGEHALYKGKIAPRVADIRDGTSNTIMVVEANADRAVVWSRPDDLNYDPQNPLAGLVGLHPGGFQALFCDGSVHFIAATVDTEMLRRLFDPNDGKPVSGF